jgi:tetraacyldisaccharide-1-P 4'-kinase
MGAACMIPCYTPTTGTWFRERHGEGGVEKRIPVLVVSGFLGAGKTTLVRHLLHDAQRTGVRVAVVSNEFGALGIDKALLGEGEEAYV